MDKIAENITEKMEELNTHLKKFLEKNNNSAGTKARKAAQEMKKLLQDLRVDILDEQKSRKESKKK